MPTTRPSVLPTWADAGVKQQPTDSELLVGWPVTDIPPSRERFNWFFNFAANAVRYLSRRGLSDWIANETYTIGDRCISPVDQKTYKSTVVDNINFEPTLNVAKWERWGWTLSELNAWLAAYLATALSPYALVSALAAYALKSDLTLYLLKSEFDNYVFGKGIRYDPAACPATGPTAAPTLAAPANVRKSTLGEVWMYLDGAWRVVSKRYGESFANVNHSTSSGVESVFQTFVVPRDGVISCAISFVSGGASGQSAMVRIYQGGINILAADTSITSGADPKTFASAAAVCPVTAGMVLTACVFTNLAQYPAAIRSGFHYVE